MSKVLVRPVLLSFFKKKNQTLIIFKYDWKFLIGKVWIFSKGLCISVMSSCLFDWIMSSKLIAFLYTVS